MTVKNAMQAVWFAGGAALGVIIGPLNVPLETLLVFMALDFALGCTCAFLGVSTKTESGYVSSKAMFLGISKKAAELAIVCVGFWLDNYTGLGVVRDGAIMTLVLNETVSIIEKCSRLGVIDIPAIDSVLDIMNSKVNGGNTKK